jgi:hypothetical protein
MELKNYLSTPSKNGQIVEDYLKVLKVDVEYPAFSLNDKLEIIECKGIISNNGSWNYHNNYDDSQNELYIIVGTKKTCQWFTLNKEDVAKVQKENIEKWKAILSNELSRLEAVTA